mmetsp:Transcript_39014/g.90429  ORF Transcript_39014/g.90429 Transcript_39014/m.90429 type:complete len:334 (+) Transcript_39014:34-1035(+)
MASRSRDSPTFVALVQAVAGASGGVFASFVLMPLEVVKTRIQISQSGPPSAMDTAQHILHREGLGGLFCGVSTKCAETGSKNFIYFYIYDALNVLAKRRTRLTAAAKLVLGFAAGVGCSVLTMPLEVLATRLQAGGSSAGEVLSAILAADGLAGLFKGFWFNIALCINPAIQNTCFDKLKAALLRLKRREKRPALTPLQAFMLGALAKAVATVVTFPLVRLKTMLQAGKQPALPTEGGRALEHSASTPEMLRALSFRAEKEPVEQTPLQRLAQLYRGLGSALWKSVLQAALLYMTKNQVEGVVIKVFKITARTFFRRDGRLKLGAWSGRPLAS